MSARFNILSLSGGGYLGLYSAKVLSLLEELTGGKPIARSSELLAGTSVGGIIALGLAAEVEASKILSAFKERGPLIFPDRPEMTSKLGMAKYLWKYGRIAKYTSDALRETIEELLPHKDMKLGDLSHRVIIPAVNLSTGAPRVFKTPHKENITYDARLRVVDVALATSAAPTFLPMSELNGALHADGGLFANAPDILALHEAEHFLHQDVSLIHMLSIGTTTSKFSFSHKTGRNFGPIQWMKGQRLIKAMMASQQKSVEFMISHRLQERYLRLDEEQSPEQNADLALDAATPHAISTLMALGEQTGKEARAMDAVIEFLHHDAPAAGFFGDINGSM
ncbi:CBASS cGAMP-activated phospholipase [Ruegeria arenilitoris]|uniref:CBASS cGAMP-activated phospholipase n=1 Tax=Ruegeria arenilitoris TaxID=1173585 RepID=UPI00147AF946|nr:CBASS cGAMP-activated phospholipase [Ruegeria arenilitoris]